MHTPAHSAADMLRASGFVVGRAVPCSQPDGGPRAQAVVAMGDLDIQWEEGADARADASHRWCSPDGVDTSIGSLPRPVFVRLRLLAGGGPAGASCRGPSDHVSQQHVAGVA